MHVCIHITWLLYVDRLNEGFTVFLERKIAAKMYGEKERQFVAIGMCVFLCITCQCHGYHGKLIGNNRTFEYTMCVHILNIVCTIPSGGWKTLQDAVSSSFDIVYCLHSSSILGRCIWQ